MVRILVSFLYYLEIKEYVNLMGFFLGFLFFQNFICVCEEGEGGRGEKPKIENSNFLFKEI